MVGYLFNAFRVKTCTSCYYLVQYEKFGCEIFVWLGCILVGDILLKVWDGLYRSRIWSTLLLWSYRTRIVRRCFHQKYKGETVVFGQTFTRYKLLSSTNVHEIWFIWHSFLSTEHHGKVFELAHILWMWPIQRLWRKVETGTTEKLAESAIKCIIYTFWVCHYKGRHICVDGSRERHNSTESHTLCIVTGHTNICYRSIWKNKFMELCNFRPGLDCGEFSIRLWSWKSGKNSEEWKWR